MYRKPRFLEELHAIREEMARDADYAVELFTEMVRSGLRPRFGAERNIRGYKSRAPRSSADADDLTPKVVGKARSRAPRERKRASR